MQAVPTKLSLDHYRRIMGVPAMHFWGVNIPEMEKAICSQAWFQYGWQDGDRVAREDIAQAIAEAEAEIEQVIGYRLLPTWEEDEWRPTIRPYRRELYNLMGRDIRGQNAALEANWGYMITGGIRGLGTLFSSQPVTYANDGVFTPATYDNVATVTFTTAVEYPDDEIALYYPGHAGDERWRIRPLNVSHTAGLDYTVTFARELALKPEHFEAHTPETIRAALGTTDSNFLDEVDVCRVYNDPQQQATLLWEGATAGCGSCSACSYGTQTGCLLLRDDPRLSFLVYQPASWDADTLSMVAQPLAVCRGPDLVRLWYYAGWRDKASAHPTIQMDEQWARVVAYYATSKLERPACSCSKEAFAYWQQDLAFGGGAESKSVYNLSDSDLGNPFGTRRGAVNAWRRVKMPGTIIGRGTTMG